MSERPWEINWNIKKLDEAVESFKKYIKELEDKVEETQEKFTGKILPIPQYPTCQSYELVERRTGYSFNDPQTIRGIFKIQ